GITALLDGTNLAVHSQQAGSIVGSALKSCCRRNARIHPQLELAVKRWAMKHQQVARVSAGYEWNTCPISPLQVLLRLVESHSEGFEPFEEHQHLVRPQRLSGVLQEPGGHHLLDERPAEHLIRMSPDLRERFNNA